MKKDSQMRYFHTLILLLITTMAFGQLPKELTSQRTVVIVDTDLISEANYTLRTPWKKFALEAHKKLRQIGIDAIIYINEDDLTAGPEVSAGFEEILNTREIKNTIRLSKHMQNGISQYSLAIYNFNNKLQLNNPEYQIENTDLNELMLFLGKEVIRNDLKRTNFLIPEVPEFLDDMVLYTGTRYPVLPSRLKSLKLAVIAFPIQEIPSSASAKQKQEIAAANELAKVQNEELAQIMKSYPFDYEILPYESPQNFYKKGFQYMLVPITSTGTTVKKMLDYDVNKSENMLITEIMQPNGKSVLKKYPAKANLTKYYIKQTIVMDLHVGKVWDADTTWQQALRNLITNLKIELKVAQ